MAGLANLIVERERLKLIYVNQKLDLDNFESRHTTMKNNIRIKIIIFTMKHKVNQLDNRIDQLERQIQQIQGQQAA